MKRKFQKSTNGFILLLISLLGFATACHDDPMAEYGVPTANYIVNGTIVSAADNKQIPDIIVEMRDATNRGTVPYIPGLIETGFSRMDGTYFLTAPMSPWEEPTFQIKFIDTDGPANGEYQTLDTTVVFTDPQFTGGDGSWYKGYVEKILDVKLKPKE